MAKSSPTTENARWASAQNNLRVANLAWSAIDLEENCPAREKVARTLTKARMALFSVPARSISDVAEKLSIWWGEAIWADDYEAHQNRIVIGDLRRIALQSVGVEEPEVSGRSPEEATELAEKWRAALADCVEEQRLLLEHREDADINALLHAEGVLIELPAPTLAGVVHKLELLWEENRYDSVEAGAFYQYLFWDLNRLARHTAEEASNVQ